MTRKVYVYRNGQMVEKPVVHRRRAPSVMIDAYSNNPTRSPVDGSVIGCRADLREHNRRNNVVDVGNDRCAIRPSAPAINNGRDIAEAISTAYDKLDQGNPDALRAVEAAKWRDHKEHRRYDE